MLIPHISSTVEDPRPVDDGPPASIIIVGSGVFGLTTALSLSHRPTFANTTITVIDKSPFPAADGSSIDSSRIVRADYKDGVYARLAAEALEVWRLPCDAAVDTTAAEAAASDDTDDEGNNRMKRIYAGIGAEGRYSESGLVLVGDGDVEYVSKSYENVKSQLSAAGEAVDKVKFLPDKDAIVAAMQTGGVSGSQGYYNPFSGWANAEATMMWVRKQCEGRENIRFITAEVKTLWVGGGQERSRVEGVVLDNGDMLAADITVLAAGAWSSGLLDLTGRAVSTGQVMAYVNVTEEEEKRLKNIPLTLNLSNGVFYFPPSKGVMKIAKHAFGYVNTVIVEGFDRKEGVTISRPVTAISLPGLRIPEVEEEMLKKELEDMVPMMKGRVFAKTRMCWYTDT
ncbi:hypothetical protein ABW20_dc0100728 [Dactylellina cionopaga]|nr:hypothetical protein ABW20_dc0100728 [Dactylellina cionopaga]